VTFIWGLSRMLENIALLKLEHIKRAIVVGRAGFPPKILFHNVHLHRIIFQRMELAWITLFSIRRLIFSICLEPQA